MGRRLARCERRLDVGVDYLVIKRYSQHLMSAQTRAYAGTANTDVNRWVEDLERLSTGRFIVVVRSQTMATAVSDGRGYGKCHATPFHWRRGACWEYVRTELDIGECRKSCRMQDVNRYLEEALDPGPRASFI